MEQKKLVVKNSVIVKDIDLKSDTVTLVVPISGLIEAKEGKDTHVTVSDKLTLPRSDGKAYSLQINGWYK